MDSEAVRQILVEQDGYRELELDYIEQRFEECSFDNVLSSDEFEDGAENEI